MEAVRMEVKKKEKEVEQMNPITNGADSAKVMNKAAPSDDSEAQKTSPRR